MNGKIGYVTPWCQAYTVGNKRTWFYETARWSNGDTYSSISNPEYGDVLKAKSQEYNEAPVVAPKMFVQDLPCQSYMGHKLTLADYPLTPPFEVGGIVHVTAKGVTAIGRMEGIVALDNKFVCGCGKKVPQHDKPVGVKLTFPKKAGLFNLVNGREGSMKTAEGYDYGNWLMVYYSAGHEGDTVYLVNAA